MPYLKADTERRIAEVILSIEGPFSSDQVLSLLQKEGITVYRPAALRVLESLEFAGYVEYGYQQEGCYAFQVVEQPPDYVRRLNGYD